MLTVASMSMTVDELVTEIRSLPHDVVADVVDRVLFESHGGQEPQQTREWSQIVHRRIDEIRTGTVEGIPGEQTAAKIREIVGR